MKRIVLKKKKFLNETNAALLPWSKRGVLQAGVAERIRLLTSPRLKMETPREHVI
jgi:hypothetical protein